MSDLKRYDLQACWCGGSQVELDIEEHEDGDWIKASDFDELNTLADGWISCDERLPEVGQSVDVYLKKKRFAGRRLTNMRWMKSLEQFRSEVTRQHYNLDSISHWMPLPSPPEAK